MVTSNMELKHSKLITMRIVFAPITQYRQYHIDFGFKTPLWKSIYWFTITQVWFGPDMTVEYAEIEFKAIKNWKFWFK